MDGGTLGICKRRRGLGPEYTKLGDKSKVKTRMRWKTSGLIEDKTWPWNDSQLYLTSFVSALGQVVGGGKSLRAAGSSSMESLPRRKQGQRSGQGEGKELGERAHVSR